MVARASREGAWAQRPIAMTTPVGVRWGTSCVGESSLSPRPLAAPPPVPTHPSSNADRGPDLRGDPPRPGGGCQARCSLRPRGWSRGLQVRQKSVCEAPERPRACQRLGSRRPQHLSLSRPEAWAARRTSISPRWRRLDEPGSAAAAATELAAEAGSEGQSGGSVAWGGGAGARAADGSASPPFLQRAAPSTRAWQRVFQVGLLNPLHPPCPLPPAAPLPARRRVWLPA